MDSLMDAICVKENGGCANDHVRKEVIRYLYIFILILVT